MLIRGLWRLCDDSIVRPVIESEVLAADGSWLPVELLVDVGADRTVSAARCWLHWALTTFPPNNSEAWAAPLRQSPWQPMCACRSTAARLSRSKAPLQASPAWRRST